jgi:hypothetical protein
MTKDEEMVQARELIWGEGYRATGAARVPDLIVDQTNLPATAKKKTCRADRA